MDNALDKENAEKAVDTYDQFFGAEVCLPDERGRNNIARVTKRVKYNEGNPRGIEHPSCLHITNYMSFHFAMNKWKSLQPT